MQFFLVGYRGTYHLSLKFSSYTHSPKGSGTGSESRWPHVILAPAKIGQNS